MTLPPHKNERQWQLANNGSKKTSRHSLGWVIRMTIIPACISLVFAGSYSIGSAITAQKNQLLERARGAIEHIDHALLEHHLDIQKIALEESVIQLTRVPEAGQRRLVVDPRRFSFLDRPWQSLLVTDRSGSINFSTHSQDPRTHVSQDRRVEAAFQEALRGGVYYSDALPGGEDGAPDVIFAVPVREKNGEVDSIAGAVVARVNWRNIADILDNVPHRAYLYSKDGDLIASTAGNEEPFHTNDPERSSFALLKKAMAEKPGKVILRGEGESTDQIAYATQRGEGSYLGNNWLLVLERPALDAPRIAQLIQQAISKNIIPGALAF